MSIARHHAEWLSLVEVSGPFLSMPVLMRVSPQGLEAHDAERFRLLRMAYEEWEDNEQAGRRQNPAIHGQWIRFVLRNLLELPDACIAEGQAIPQTLQADMAQHSELLRPNIVIRNPDGGPGGGKPRLLVQTYPSTQDLSKPVSGHTWKASPETRMMELLHATGVRLGLVTNGEHWMLVDAPRNETTGFASWYAHLWLEEPITLRAFTSLFNANRFFGVPDSDALEGMLAESANNQQEVTDQLGYQVRKAVEVLVQSLDQADQDHGHQLLANVTEAELYEAALTVMMRLVFLFCAEERGLLLLGDSLYDEHYAVSTLWKQLRETADQHGEEILERRHDAWCRLLSTFRAVYGGVEHERMRLPAYDGRLFNPDRFPFLEGRKKDTTWRTHSANPLPVDNRTVLHLLESLQFLQVKVPGGGPAEARRLSFRALDIEQIGHVYEGLLDHTAKRATEPVLGLAGTKDKEPEIPLSQLEQVASKGEEALIEFLEEQIGRSAKAIKKALHGEIDLTDCRRFEAACAGSGDGGLFDRIKPFIGLIRDDTFEHPVVIRQGSVYVTAGTDRRSSGTHYTPRDLTRPIVQYTLEPLVYVGPAEGKPEKEWTLRPAGEILDLKVCDMACGSGAFLVQACRYMSERLQEAWELAEESLPKGIPGITPEGTASTGRTGETIIPKDPDERKAYSQRLIAQRCLYGVDINPLACEMAKLSLWLLTLAKNKPFTFLDHAIRCGDSLLGLHNLTQLKTFSFDGTGQQYVFGEESLERLVDEAIEARLRIEGMSSNSVEDVEAQARLMADCDRGIGLLKCAADMLIAPELKPGTTTERLGYRDSAAIQVGHHLRTGDLGQFRATAAKAIDGRRTFHWPLEFPEVVVRRGGFDAFIGNPPFSAVRLFAATLGQHYARYLFRQVSEASGNVDLSAFFLRRALRVASNQGCVGLILTKSIAEGATRRAALEPLDEHTIIYRAWKSLKWPGTASVAVSLVHMTKRNWQGNSVLDGEICNTISPELRPGCNSGEIHQLATRRYIYFRGSDWNGAGFLIDEEAARALIRQEPNAEEYLLPCLNAEEYCSSPQQMANRWCIFCQSLALADIRDKAPKLVEVLKERVYPERIVSKDRRLREYWWLFRRPTMQLYEAAWKRESVFVVAFIAKFICFCRVKSHQVFANTLTVFPDLDWGGFAMLQSSIHDVWARERGGHLEDRFRYSPTDCFETFPFPLPTASTQVVGTEYHQHRLSILTNSQVGLTTAYNRFHNPDEIGEDIQGLRDLHARMDNAVAIAYGWDDLKLGHDFHETKQGLRFTISESARREVLARLLKLNHERYAEEVAQGLHDKKKGKGRTGKNKASKGKTKGVGLFGQEEAL